jgi:cytochrome c553
LLLVLALLLAVLTYIAFFSSDVPVVRSAAQGEADPREAVALNPEQLDYALSQMRGLLVSVQSLDSANYEGDYALMSRLSAEQGPGPKPGRKQPEGFSEALPEGFRALSGQMRKSFAAMEMAAGQQDDAAFHAAKQQALGTCATCHEAYRFVPDSD